MTIDDIIIHCSYRRLLVRPVSQNLCMKSTSARYEAAAELLSQSSQLTPPHPPLRYPPFTSNVDDVCKERGAGV